MASSSVEGDKYRSFIHGEGEKNTKWRYGAPPNYDVVNKLFEEGRTKIWPPGSLEEKIGGGYNSFMQTSLPEKLRGYNPAEETVDSAHVAFTTAFPRGFALEVLQVYSGPPVIVYKFRHWAYMEGPFKGHAPTGELVEVFGMSILHVDEDMKILKVEFFLDRGELLGGLMKGAILGGGSEEVTLNCPFLRNTG
ncbi:hypothetical protein SLEP1_g39776 [Rubroshorea leprosula]|uniref:Pathogen-related protein n=1 Tax=Rubroshorea leprosula TaxID=152421 RepID=A0AAV5L1C5_9ROSI|nr:hypothetical protein SLEP1_g39776 [Rubroshorea leprosula]